jgi:hypothetical protein
MTRFDLDAAMDALLDRTVEVLPEFVIGAVILAAILLAVLMLVEALGAWLLASRATPRPDRRRWLRRVLKKRDADELLRSGTPK